MSDLESKPPIIYHNAKHDHNARSAKNRNVIISILKADYRFCDRMEDCDIFLNFFEPGSWQAVDDLYKAWDLNVNRVITINSIIGDWIYSPRYPARISSIQSKAVSIANSQLYFDGLNCTNLILGEWEDGRNNPEEYRLIRIVDVMKTLEYVMDHNWIKEMTIMAGKNRREMKTQG